MSQKFGEKLRAARTRRGVTLDQLAEAVGSSKAYVWQLENKKNAKPSAELLLRIADFFAEDPHFFLDDNVDERDEAHLDEALFRKIKRLSERDKKLIEQMISGIEGDKKSSTD